MRIKYQWLFALAYILIAVGMMIGLAYYLNRPSCQVSASCVWEGVLVTAVTLIAVTFSFAAAYLYWLKQPIRQMSLLARRIASGDTKARLLLNSPGALDDLARAFNDMRDQLVSQVDGLEKRQRQLALILQHMADGVLIVDGQGYVQLINPAAVSLLNTPADITQPRTYAEVVRHHQLIDLYHRCRATKENQVAAFEMGNGRFWQAVITPFTEHETLGYLVILQDLTAIRHLETVRRDFISNLSHELRTPLASLRAVMETLQDGALDDPPAALRFLGRGVHEVDTMTQMVEELLELSQIESGRVPLRLQATAVSDLIIHPVGRLRTLAESGNIKLLTDLPLDLPLVLADPRRIEQVVGNLLHNAIKFTPPGGKVTIRAYLNDEKAAAHDSVIIEVKDSGMGIAANDLPRIFERFYKSDRARTRGRSGTGLGLAIARHLVEAHNGRIWVRSLEGKGSTFYFSLLIADN